jgi:hypothetical protein
MLVVLLPPFFRVNPPGIYDNHDKKLHTRFNSTLGLSHSPTPVINA